MQANQPNLEFYCLKTKLTYAGRLGGRWDRGGGTWWVERWKTQSLPAYLSPNLSLFLEVLLPNPTNHSLKIILGRGQENHFMSSWFFDFFKKTYLSALGLSCSMWDLVPSPGIKPWPPALGAWSLSHWTTREVPSWVLRSWILIVFFIFKNIYLFGYAGLCNTQDLQPSLRHVGPSSLTVIENGPLALGAWSLGHWTIREDPLVVFYFSDYFSLLSWPLYPIF